jgi:GT2 family glycosyltransferase
MTIYILIPVHNRLDQTKIALKCIHNQLIDHEFRTIIVDDGSTDGTREYLEQYSNLLVLQGDGNLWWGGSIELGLKYILSIASMTDWVLLLNNDTFIGPDFICSLLESALSNMPAVVGSVICDIHEPNRVLSIGPEIDPWRLQVRDKLRQYRERDSTITSHSVDALSGRGTLYPVKALISCGTMRPRILPHYYADYELSLRAKNAGYKLLTSEKSPILSLDQYGNSKYFPIPFRFISKNSPLYLPAYLAFWVSASNGPLQIATLFPRLVFKSFLAIFC